MNFDKTINAICVRSVSKIMNSPWYKQKSWEDKDHLYSYFSTIWNTMML